MTGMDGSGRHYDEVNVGDAFRRSLTVTDTHLVVGAGLIGDFEVRQAEAERATVAASIPPLQRAVAQTEAALAALSSCDESLYTGAIKPNDPPTIKLTSGPPEGDTTAYTIHFSWVGNDADGTIDHYELALASGDPFGFDPADTTGLDKWTRTRATDSLFTFDADEESGDILYGLSSYTLYLKAHTLFQKDRDYFNPVLDLLKSRDS